jgi:hypothetical protein
VRSGPAASRFEHHAAVDRVADHLGEAAQIILSANTAASPLPTLPTEST